MNCRYDDYLKADAEPVYVNTFVGPMGTGKR